MVSLLLAFGLALADEPSALLDGAVVRGSASVAVSAQRFLAELRDPAFEGRAGATGTRATVTGQDGACQRVSYVAPNAILEARYELRRCPVADGWEATLITSNAFDAYRSRWRVVPEGEGARVTYEVDLSTSLWVPDSLVRSETRRAVLKMMRSLAAWSMSPG